MSKAESISDMAIGKLPWSSNLVALGEKLPEDNVNVILSWIYSIRVEPRE